MCVWEKILKYVSIIKNKNSRILNLESATDKRTKKVQELKQNCKTKKEFQNLMQVP